MRKTEVPLKESDKKIKYKQKICFVGSCFAENIAAKMTRAGFEVNSNPLGVMFNPNSIAKILNGDSSLVDDLAYLKKDNIHLNWHANSKVYGAGTLAEYRAVIEARISHFKQDLANSDFLFITFGSAFAYRHKATHQIVANCHKIPQKEFEKELLSLDELKKEWQECLSLLQEKYPHLTVVFTVSPVRHIKDGLIENTRSKARLFELISSLENFECTSYFPAYEIVLDECRDYAFFEADGVHPNSFAVEKVWDYFCAMYLEESTQKVMHKFLGFRNFFEHRDLHPESSSALAAKELQKEKLSAFLAEHPYLENKI